MIFMIIMIGAHELPYLSQ